MKKEEFRQLLQTVADGWNAGDARLAADRFTEDAVYVEPRTANGTRGGNSSPTSSGAAWSSR